MIARSHGLRHLAALIWCQRGTQHIHILARCLVCPGFCQHSPIVHFQQSAGFEHTTQMAATNPNKTWRVESPWENMRKHNNMSLWSYSTLVRRSLVTRSCDLLWVRHSWKTVVRCDSFVPHFCETLLGLKTLVRHSCEILLQDALLTHCGTTDKQWVKRYI